MPLVNENKSFQCDECKKILPIIKEGRTLGYGGGYGQVGTGPKWCYDCIAKADVLQMNEDGFIFLYIKRDDPPWENPPFVVNFPGTLQFIIPPGWMKHSKHNIAKERIDVWFIGPDGARWHGVSFGDSQLARCHRLKRQRKHLTPLKESVYLKPYPYEK